MKSRTSKRAWRRLRLEILERDGYRCRKCGKAGRLEVDHIKPLRRGGDEYSPGNLQAICRGCHIEKTRTEQTTHRPDPRWQLMVAEYKRG